MHSFDQRDLILLSTGSQQQSRGYGEANDGEAALGRPGLFKKDLLRCGVVAAAEFVEAIPPSPVTLIKGKPEKTGQPREEKPGQRADHAGAPSAQPHAGGTNKNAIQTAA